LLRMMLRILISSADYFSRLTEVNAPITGSHECNRFSRLLANGVAQNPR